MATCGRRATLISSTDLLTSFLLPHTPPHRADYLVVPSDLSPFNASGGAIAGTAAYLSTPEFQDQASPLYFVAPALNALGPVAQGYVQRQLQAGSFNLADGVPAWQVASQSSSQVCPQGSRDETADCGLPAYEI